MTIRMTAAELIEASAKPKKQGRVRNAKRTKVGDITFDSELEARWWLSFKTLEKAGDISDLRRQVKIPLMGRDGPILTPTGIPMHYVADFAWIEGGKQQYGDAKGHRTEVYLMKRAILAAQGITIREFK